MSQSITLCNYLDLDVACLSLHYDCVMVVRPWSHLKALVITV